MVPEAVTFQKWVGEPAPGGFGHIGYSCVVCLVLVSTVYAIATHIHTRIIHTRIMHTVLERWLGSYKPWLFFQGQGLGSPAPTLGSTQLATCSSSSRRTQVHLHSYAYTCIYMLYMHIINNKSFKNTPAYIYNAINMMRYKSTVIYIFHILA